MAQLKRVQEVKVNDLESYKLTPDTSLVPSYGIGFKLAVTDNFGIKVSYDAWKTPVGGGSSTTDDAIRAGVTWIF